jgi:acetyl esterase/lipase
MAFLSPGRIGLAWLPGKGRAWLVAITAAVALWHIGWLAAAAPDPQERKYEPQARKYQVRTYCDIRYYKIRNDPDATRHQLDIYRPIGKGRYPVLFFLHGGAWVAGSKDNVFGVYGYGTIARCLAERGLVVIVPNYRLSPGVRHPEHIKDVARAFAWTYRHCEAYGGDRQLLFVGGHSAGGHLAALLATDESYLKQVGRAVKDLRGVIGVSGVYRVDDFDLKLLVKNPSGTIHMKLDVRPLMLVFGRDRKVIRKASPVNQVRRGLPPFLLLCGGWDYPPLRRMTKDFSAALQRKGVRVREKEIPWRTHETLLFDIPRLSADAATSEAILQFIQRHSSKASSGKK